MAARNKFGRLSTTGTISADVTVPPGQRWCVMAIGIHYTCNDQAGERFIVAELVVSAAVQGAVESAVTMVADDELRYWFASGLASSSDSRPAGPTTIGVATEPIPQFVAEAGDIIRGRARAGSDAGDVCVVTAHYELEVFPV